MTQCRSLWGHQRCCSVCRWCRPWSEMWCLTGNRVPRAPSHLWVGGREREKHYTTRGFPQDHLELLKNVMTCFFVNEKADDEKAQNNSNVIILLTRYQKYLVVEWLSQRDQYILIFSILQKSSHLQQPHWQLVTHLSKLMRDSTTSLGAGPLQCRV